MFDFFRRHTRAAAVPARAAGLSVVRLLRHPGLQPASPAATSRRSPRSPASRSPRPSSTPRCASASSGRGARCRASTPKLFETPEMRRIALDGVIRDRLHARRRRQAAPRRRATIASSARSRAIPQFASLRNPDGSVNRDTLAALGMSSEAFAERLRQDLARRQVMQAARRLGDRAGRGGVGRARRDVPAARGAGRALRRQGPARQGRRRATPRSRRTTRTRRTRPQFQAPEQATIEYVVLDLESLKKNIAVSEDDLRKYYAENEKRFTSPEERRASHILSRPTRTRPRPSATRRSAKAEALLAEVRKNPQSFAEVAKQELRRRRLGGQGRRPRLLRPRRDGQAVRGRGLRPQAGRDRAASSRATSATTSSRSTGARGGEKKSFDAVRADDRERGPQPAGAEAVRRRRGRVRRHRLRAARQPQARRRQVEARDQNGASTSRARRRPARAARSPTQVPRGAVQQRGDARQAQHQGDRRRRRTSSPPAASSSTRRRTSCRSPR